LFARNHYRSFSKASEDLLSDEEFMLEALDIQPKIYRYVAKELQNDMDIRVAASRDKNRCDENDMVEYDDVYAHVHAGLTNHKAFTTFLFCTHEYSGSHVSLLNQGPDKQIMRCIADFAFVPTGRELRRFRRSFRGAAALLIDSANLLP
jgi:hypothetical protein